MISLSSHVVVTTADESLLPQARLIAQRLGLSAKHHQDVMEPNLIQLMMTPQGLVLKDPQAGEETPVKVDFTAAKLLYRCQQAGAAKQSLAKAVGIKPGIRPSVIDATAGLGRDGFVLAALGCQVCLVERNPVVVELLRDGLARASSHKYAGKVVQSCIKLISENAVKFIERLQEDERADVVYIDPMFPPREKSARIKKEMRLFQSLVGVDEDFTQLLDVALKSAKKRVVVKRPSKGPESEVRTPQLTITGKSTRYDIYFTHH